MKDSRMRLQLSPSILTADLAGLGAAIESVDGSVDQFHLDVMDGHYVPNITFGPDVVAAIRGHTDRPFHVHLMIDEPLAYAGRFVEAGAGRLSFHPEVVDDVPGTIEGIRDAGAEVGIAVHPDLGVEEVEGYLGSVDVVLMMTVRPGFGGQSFIGEVLPKISRVRALVESRGLGADIEVDGGVKLDNLAQVVEAGAGIIVAGSAIFDGKDPAAAARRFRRSLDDLEGELR